MDAYSQKLKAGVKEIVVKNFRHGGNPDAVVAAAVAAAACGFSDTLASQTSSIVVGAIRSTLTRALTRLRTISPVGRVGRRGYVGAISEVLEEGASCVSIAAGVPLDEEWISACSIANITAAEVSTAITDLLNSLFQGCGVDDLVRDALDSMGKSQGNGDDNALRDGELDACVEDLAYLLSLITQFRLHLQREASKGVGTEASSAYEGLQVQTISYSSSVCKCAVSGFSANPCSPVCTTRDATCRRRSASCLERWDDEVRRRRTNEYIRSSML